MIMPRTLAQRLTESRLAGLPAAVRDTLRPLFPDVAVQTMAGKLDVSDLLDGETFQPPLIAVTLTRWRAPVAVDGSWSVPVDLAAYVVTADMAVGAKALRREEVAWAICHGLLVILSDLDMGRWGLSLITLPDEAEARPVFTSQTFAKGVGYYAVTWRQRLLGEGDDPLARTLITQTNWPEHPIDDDGWPQ